MNPEPPPPEPEPLAPRPTPTEPKPDASAEQGRHSTEVAPAPAVEREISPSRVAGGRHLDESEEPDENKDKPRDERTTWQRWRPFVWALALTFVILNIGRCGFVADIFSDPAGEQWLTILETETKAAGLTDQSWICIEGEMRDGGYVDELNKEDMTKIDESLNSPQRLPTPELGRFLDGFRLFYDPGQATSCVTQTEFDANNLPTVNALYLTRTSN